MLTAVSVARDCGMVRPHENIIVADAAPPRDSLPPCITWRYVDKPAQTASDDQVSLEVSRNARLKSLKAKVMIKKRLKHVIFNNNDYCFKEKEQKKAGI